MVLERDLSGVCLAYEIDDHLPPCCACPFIQFGSACKNTFQESEYIYGALQMRLDCFGQITVAKEAILLST